MTTLKSIEFAKNTGDRYKDKDRIKYRYEGKFDPNKLHPYSIDAQSAALIEKNKRVLEIGCATGFMSEYFTQQLQCTVIGVEINPKQAVLAQKKCFSVITGNIEEDQTFQKIKESSEAIGGIDIILASSVL